MSAKTLFLWLWVLVGTSAAAALIWQWRHPPHPPITATDDGSRLPELPAAPPLEPFQLPPLEQYSEVMARPLFIAARRPESPPEDTAPEPPPADPERTFVLLGVMMTPETTMVLLQPEEPNAKPERVRAGGTVGGWRLETVLPDRVVLRKDQATQELKLVRPRTPPGPRPARRPARPVRNVPPTVGQPAPVVTPEGEAPPPQTPEMPQN